MILGIDARLANATQPAGAGHYCREVLRALATLVHGMELRLYLDQEPGDTFPDGDWECRILPRRPFWTHRTLSQELRRDPPDVFLSPVTQVPWCCPCPALVSVLDLAVRSHPAYFPWRKRLAMRLQSEHAIRRGDHFIVISESTARDLGRYYPMASDRITVAHLGVNEAFFDIGKTGVNRDALPPGVPDHYVLYVGQVQPRKNLLRLVDAFSQVCEGHPEISHHLVLAGADGWQHEAIHQAIIASPVANRIHRLGYVPDANMPALIANADVLALVSLSEGFGLPAVEAMAASTAVLASNCSSLPEIVGNAGLLVDPCDTNAIADGLLRLFTDEKLRQNYECDGRTWAQQFRWKKTAAAIVAAAKKLAHVKS